MSRRAASTSVRRVIRAMSHVLCVFVYMFKHVICAICATCAASAESKMHPDVESAHARIATGAVC